MGVECSQGKPCDIGVLWGELPPNGEIVITRDKITITEKPNLPKLDISNRVIYWDSNIAEEHDLWENQFKHIPDDVGNVSERFNSPGSLARLSSNSSSVEVISNWPSNAVINQNQFDDTETEMSPEVEIISQRKLLESSSVIPYDDSQGSVNSLVIGEMPERKPNTHFKTLLDSGTDSESAMSVEPFLQQWVDAVESKLAAETDVDITPKKVHRMSPVKTTNGAVLPKKIATMYEQKGKIECHVYFTPRTSAEIWPRLVVTVNEDWNFLKVMRKSIAEIQRAIKKGDRDGTHDWVFEYHPNKQVRKIKKELRVLFGATAVEFRDSNLKKKIKSMTKDFVNKVWVLQKKGSGGHTRGKSSRTLQRELGHLRAKSMPLIIKQEEKSKLEVPTDQTSEERDSTKTVESVDSDKMHERKPTTLFQTFLDIGSDSSADVEAFLQQQDDAVEQKVDTDTNLTSRKVRSISIPISPKDDIYPKKIATGYEQKGKLECHVYFTPRTSAEVWPRLVVTVKEDWDFLKVMRKSIAEMQRAIKKGDRDGTHDWIFAYHPNKQVKKIKKELRVLFGAKAVEFRDSNLKKQIKTMTKEFVNKMWVLPKKGIGEKNRGRHNRTVKSQSGFHRAKSQPPFKKKKRGVPKVSSKRRSRKKNR